VFGTNEKEKPQPTGFCNMVLAALDDLMLKVLLVCAVFSIVVDMSFAAGESDPIKREQKLKTGWIEGFAILTAVAVVSLFGAWSDYNKEKQFLK
jgi:magnesium-transporting ATPase (P-type)